MSALRSLLAGVLAAGSFAAMADAPPLSLEDVLRSSAAPRAADAAPAATRGLPYRLIGRIDLDGLEPAAAHRMEAMARFFDVILTDLEATALGERMSVAYGQWVRLNGRTPESAETARAFLAYRELFSKRNEARMHQRLSRSSLALAMGRGGDLPSELVEPELSGGELSSAEALQAMLQGKAPPAGKARHHHALTATVLELDWLIRAERPRAKARAEHAERVVDEARDQLAAGGSPDLGGAMAAIVEAQQDERKVDFRIRLLTHKLEALAGAAAAVSRGR